MSNAWKKTTAYYRSRIRARESNRTTPPPPCGRCGNEAWIIIGDLGLCCACWTLTPVGVR